jgi:hypothetical protein
MKRKGNYAAYEKENTPHAGRQEGWNLKHNFVKRLSIKDPERYCCEKGLASDAHLGVNIFTYEAKKNHQLQNQSSGFAAQRHDQCQLRESLGSPFPGGGVFRSARPDAGQIRDAASRSEGRHGHFDRGFEFRNVSPIILQSPARFRTRGHEWVNSPATWSAKASQADPGGIGVRDSDSSRGAASENLGTDRAASAEVWHPRPPQVFGESSARCEKKTAPALVGDGGRSCQSSTMVLIDYYERLRHHALSRCIFPAMRLGYGVLVGRGVAAWLDVAEEMTRSLQPPCRSTEAAPATIPPQLHEDLVRVMGEVVMTLTLKERYEQRGQP